MSAQELHDRLVAVIARVAVRPVPAGDTLVDWYRGPVLYSTVLRTGSRISSSLIRNDSVVGTAEATWAGPTLRTFQVVWTRGDSTTLSFRASLKDGSIEAYRGDERLVWQVPFGLWAIADYGMEDQLVPLLDSMPDGRDLRWAIYRPFPARWDTVTVSITSTSGARIITVADKDGENFRWVLSPKGVIVRITRDRHAEAERRPLELTPAFDDYLRWKTLGNFP